MAAAESVLSRVRMSERLGQYQLEKRIGSGGMADVFLAQGPRGICVIKRPYPHLCANPDFVRMFLDEAALLAQLSHPGIAQIYDLGHVGGVYFLAMEYVPGFDLMTMSLEHERQGELIAVDLCARIIADAAAALHYAHEAIGQNGQPLNLIHRDVTPHNILLSTNAEVKLIDFGVAKSTTGTHRTEAGLVKGKYAYMAPEQITGQAIDRRVDIYALGLCLYELLTNVRAIAGTSEPEQIENARHSRMTPIERLRPNIPEPIRRIVASCVHPDPAGRYQTALEVKDQLELYLSLERRQVGREDLLRLMRVVAAEVSHFERPSDEVMGRPTEREQEAVGALVNTENADPVSAELLGGAATSPSMKMIGFPQASFAPTQMETEKATLAPRAGDGVKATGVGEAPTPLMQIPGPPPSGPTRLIPQGGGTGTTPVVEPVGKRPLWPMFVVGLLVALAGGLWWLSRQDEVAPEVKGGPGPVIAEVVDAGPADSAEAEVDAGGEMAAIVDAGAAPLLVPVDSIDAGVQGEVQVAVVNVTSTPETVVFVDGKKWGPVPQEVQVEAGKHQVLLTNGALNIRWSTSLTLKAGEQRDLKVALAQGKIHFSVTPFGKASLQGKEIFNGLSSVTKDFYEGTYVFEVSNAELKATRKLSVVVKPNETSEAAINLMQP